MAKAKCLQSYICAIFVPHGDARRAPRLLQRKYKVSAGLREAGLRRGRTLDGWLRHR